MSSDTRRNFHQQLDDISADVLRLGEMVLEALSGATEALLNNDRVIAQTIVDGDDPIDDLAVAVEDRCYQLLATQQPMAVDLRLLVTDIHLVSEIERSGDLAVNIAKAASRLPGGIVGDPSVRGLVGRLSESAHGLFTMAMHAYRDSDETVAARLDSLDDEVDDLHRAYIERMLEVCRAGEVDVQAAVQLALVGRYYERIADHAVNIGERVRYRVSGWMPATPRQHP
jgi:phosphate transport system protein